MEFDNLDQYSSSNMGKVLLAITNHSGMLGGGEHSFLDLIRSLPERWRPIVSANDGGSLVTRLRNRSIQVEIAKMPPIRPWRLFQVLGSIKSYCNLCIKHKVAVIYANGSRAAFYGGVAGRILKIPVVWHCRISEKDPLLDTILCRLSSLIIANSRATSRRFSERVQGKIRVIYNGIDIQWLKDNRVCSAQVNAQNSRIILVVARVSKLKRHDLALSAFEEAAEVYPDLELVFVGAKDPFEPEWWNYLKKRTVNSHYTERIHWTGHVEDVRPWYRAASILLLPSENEAFGRVLVEAMACGVPVVATSKGGISEIVRNGQDGILVFEREANFLSEAMMTILNNDRLRQKYIQSGNERANFFDLDTHVNKMAVVFDDLAAK